MKQRFYSITKNFKYHICKRHAFRIKNDFVNAPVNASTKPFRNELKGYPSHGTMFGGNNFLNNNLKTLIFSE